MTEIAPLPADVLPNGVRARFIKNHNGLTVHVLEAGFEASGRPCLLLLHGFPELAFSWRKIMLPLAAAGYHVIAPDQRGYGRTTGWDSSYDGDLTPFGMLNLVRDQLGLLAALGVHSVDTVIGHDFGAPVAATCALVRPDVFQSLALMSAPFAGTPTWPRAQQDGGETGSGITGLSDPRLQTALAALDPPRRHYQLYYSTRAANDDMLQCAQGVHAFLRAYYHHKSADWTANTPYPLAAWTAEALAALPTYYVMNNDEDMAETVAPHIPSDQDIASCNWLPEDELRVYSTEYERTGFQGGLQWYRCVTSGRFTQDLRTFSGRTINVPTCFIAGKSDWGAQQKPGDLEAMQTKACTQFLGCHMIEGAGHWVQQEQPEAVSRLLLDFLQQS